MIIKSNFLTNVKIGNILIQSSHPCNPTNYAVCSSRDVTHLVFHYTGNTKDTAVNNCKYYQNNPNLEASAHFFVDDNTIQQSVALKDRAWHCGNKKLNESSIGIEMCTSGNRIISEKTKDNAIQLGIYFCRMLGITADKVDTYILRHYDCNGKSCPAQFVTNPAEWTEFKNKIKTGLAGDQIKLEQWGTPIANIEHVAYIPMNGEKGETVTSAAGRATWNGRNPDAICNAEFYELATHRPASGVISKANGQNSPSEQFGIAFVNNIIPKFCYKNNLNAPDWLAGYPILIQDGKIAIPKGFKDLSGKRARTALALSDTHLTMFWVTAANGCTLEEFAAAIQKKGYKYAINFDGGGSTAGATPFWSYDQGRRTRGKVGIWVKGGTGNKLKKTPAAVAPTPAKPAAPTGGTAKPQEGVLLKDESKSKGVQLTVTANSGLNFRKAAVNGQVIAVLPKGSIVRWYGYYIVKNGVTWYCVLDSKNRTGYVSSQYVK